MNNIVKNTLILTAIFPTLLNLKPLNLTQIQPHPSCPKTDIHPT